MTNMMSIITMFNYIPDDEVFEEAMNLSRPQYGQYMNSHIIEFYLDPKDLMKLGGGHVEERARQEATRVVRQQEENGNQSSMRLLMTMPPRNVTTFFM